MSERYFLSVVIPTRNRRQLLEQALTALSLQSASKHLWEIIVVNNLSTDDTGSFLKEISLSISNLKIVNQTILGSNYARNMGAQMAKGELLAFIDDDTIPHPQWIERIMHRYQHLNIETDCVGGKVLLDYSSPLPRWHGPFLENYLSRIDLGNSFRKVDPRALCSANLILPRKALEKVGFFDLRMNRRTGNLRSNDETLTLVKLQNLGHPFFYDPAIRTFHQIGTSRLKRSFFRRRAWWQGVSDAEMERILNGKKRIWSEIIWPNLFSLYKKPSLLWLAFRPCRGPKKFALALQGQLFLGRIFGGTWAMLRK